MQYNTSWTDQLGVGVRKRRMMSTALIIFFLCLAIKWPEWHQKLPTKNPKKPQQKTANSTKQKPQTSFPPPKNQNIPRPEKTSSPRKHSRGSIYPERGLPTLFVSCSLAEKDHEEVGHKSSSLSNWRNLLKIKLKQKSEGPQESYNTFNQLVYVERKTPLMKLVAVVILKQNDRSKFKDMYTCLHTQKGGLSWQDCKVPSQQILTINKC